MQRRQSLSCQLLRSAVAVVIRPRRSHCLTRVAASAASSLSVCAHFKGGLVARQFPVRFLLQCLITLVIFHKAAASGWENWSTVLWLELWLKHISNRTSRVRRTYCHDGTAGGIDHLLPLTMAPECLMDHQHLSLDIFPQVLEARYRYSGAAQAVAAPLSHYPRGRVLMPRLLRATAA
jgi:hypothetical protein